MRRMFKTALAGIAFLAAFYPAYPASWTLQTNPATSVTLVSAVLNGYASMPYAESCPIRFQIGTESGTYTDSYFADESPLVGPSDGQNFSYSLAGLTPGQTYYYRIAMFIPSIELEAYGSEETFATDVPLSVDLAAFSGRVSAGGLLLTWTTESECGNLGFGIDRREESSSEWTVLSDFTRNPSLAGRGEASGRTEYRYLDFTVMPGHCYEYRISDTDTDGKTTVRHEIRVVYSETAIPAETRLSPAYPNPFNPETRLSIRIADDSDVSLSILDSNGRIVRRLLSKAAKKAGAYNYTWNAADDTGLPVPAGVYMILLQAGGLFHSQKVLYLK
jgi:hypothetical protein